MNIYLIIIYRANAHHSQLIGIGLRFQINYPKIETWRSTQRYDTSISQGIE